MNNFIIKFKQDLKKIQSGRKNILKQCKKELELLQEMIAAAMIVCISKQTNASIADELPISAKICPPEIDMNELFGNGEKSTKVEKGELFIIHHILSDFYEFTKKEYNETQSIINAYENDKIKDPINNIGLLFRQIAHTTLNTEEISKIIGMAISFNSQYAAKHKDHIIEEIDTINQLAKYYNQDGTFKYNEDIKTFSILMKNLDITYLDEVETIYRMLNLNTIFFYKDIVVLLKENNQRLRKNNVDNTNEKNSEKEVHTIKTETRNALQELRKYYKNGEIIAIPENLEKFYLILQQCELDENEQKYIINLISTEISKNNSLSILKYLNTEEQSIYQKAITLLNNFTYSNGDVYALKQYIEELQTISSMLETENNEQDKQYLLQDVPTIIEQLSIICDKYNINNQESTNKYIFLLNKNGVPYIYDDIEELEQIYQKAIYSLISKIDKSNQAQFRKIISNEPLLYNMYEVINPRAHIAFVEIDAGIYVIIGANIPRNGYKEFNNRLKANQTLIQQIEYAIKNKDTRNDILKSNEEYYEKLQEQDIKNHKLTLKNHN